MSAFPVGTASKIACCLCGMQMVYNPAGTCTECLRANEDITDGLDRTGILVQCGKCDRWHIDLDRWSHHELESPSLLALCLKKLKLTQQHKIRDASFIWTEPHCKRIKVSVDLEKEVMDGKVTLGSTLVVEFKVVAKQCMECIREATDHSWGAMIQVRQRVGHKRSFFQLERLLVDAGLHQLMTGVEVAREGLDMYFKSKNQADRVVELVSSNMPCQKKDSRKLVSQDKKSNTSKYELTTLLEVCPLCKGDLVLTPKGLTGSAEVMVVTKLQASIHLVNPMTLARAECRAAKYFAAPFSAVLSLQHLVSFVVLDITLLDARGAGPGAGAGAGGDAPSSSSSSSSSHSHAHAHSHSHAHPVTGGVLAECEVARETDLGDNDVTYVVRTHLGHVLAAGDTCLGYMLCHATALEDDLPPLPGGLPDVVLVRKTYPEKEKKKAGRRRERGRWVPVDKSGEEGDAAFERQLHDEAALAAELGCADLADTLDPLLNPLLGPGAEGGAVGGRDGDGDGDEGGGDEGVGDEGGGDEGFGEGAGEEEAGEDVP